MAEISNRGLMILVVATIIVSLAGTMINFHQTNDLTVSYQKDSLQGITGFSTTDTGKVNVSIASVTSITVADSVLDFGSCSPNITGTYIASNSTNASWDAAGVCTVAGSAPEYTDSLNITNDGNDDVNITVKTNLVAADFIAGTDPQFMFSIRNVTARPGCSNRSTATNAFNDTEGTANSTGMQWKWMNFSSTGFEYLACENLTYPDTKDSLALYARLFLPSDIAAGGGEKNVTLTFTATTI